MSGDERPIPLGPSSIDPIPVGPISAAWRDVERAEQTDWHRARFFEVCHALAAFYGVDVVVARSKARWDTQHDPPRLLEATVRFRHPQAPRKRPRKRAPPRL